MLTTAVAKAAAPQARGYKLADTGGLHLFVAPTGAKSWRLKYRWQGREKLLTIGRFPDIGLAEARARQQQAKAALRQGHDPGSRVDIKVNADGGHSFEALARAWHAHGLPDWSETHAADVIASLERDVFPELGRRPASSIEPTELLAVVRAVEARGCVETARRLRQRLSAVFGFGIAQGDIERDPAQHLGRAMRRGRPARPMPALTSIDDCRALLSACESAGGRRSVALASRLLALTAVRLEVVRGARWGEFDIDARIWRVPAARMKLARAKKGNELYDHIVPLSAPALAVLAEAAHLKGHDTPLCNESAVSLKSSGLVFSGRASTVPIGENALRDLYARAGFAGRHVPHGWRAAFSTILNRELPDRRADIDRALAHSPKDKVEAAYNRALLLERRRELFDRWGEMLDPETAK